MQFIADIHVQCNQIGQVFAVPLESTVAHTLALTGIGLEDQVGILQNTGHVVGFVLDVLAGLADLHPGVLAGH